MNWLRKHGLRLITSLFLGCILWAFVTYTTNPLVTETFSDIPVFVQGLSPGLIIVDQTGQPRPDQTRISQVSMLVETDRETLAELVPADDLQAAVNVSDLGPGSHTVPVNASSSRRNVAVLAVEPNAIPIRIDEIITSTVPVTVLVQGSLPFSFERDAPEVRVNDMLLIEVEVRGPSNLVERVEYAAAEVNIDQIRATYIAPLQLQPLDSNNDVVEGVDLDPEIASVQITVRSVAGIKRVPVIANVVGTPASGYLVTSVHSDPQLINLVGSSGILDRVDRVETEPIDITGATSTVTQEVALRVRGVQPQEDEPRTVIVTVEVASLDQPFQANVPVPVRLVGVEPGLLTEISPPVVQATLQASTLEFLQLSTDTLTATIDVSGFGPGLYSISPDLPLPANINLVDPIPPVRVVLRRPATATPIPSATPVPTSTPLPTLMPTITDTPEATSTSEVPAFPTDEPAPIRTPQPTTEITATQEISPTDAFEVPADSGL
ncbi:MAG: hypothetical protein HC914_07290 [Chloroflexaceae bacterium]|nr:hypothetical protein [Chloroflexaceae bacterium]